MKKILFSILFFFAISFCFPLSALGAPMEIRVEITSVRIPERAIMMGASDPNTEFRLQGGRIVVVNNTNNSVVAYTKFNYAPDNTGDLGGHLAKGMIVTLSFTYDTAIKYKVFADVIASAQGNYNLCKADCSSVPTGSGWYSTYDRVDLLNNVALASCPTESPACFSAGNTWLKYNIALNPAYIINIGGQNYWRSPALYTIN